MIRRILIPMVDAASTRSGLETALLVGLGFGAHVDALYVKRPPWQFFQFAADGVDPKEFTRRKREIENEEDRNLALARQTFEDIADQLKIERRQKSLPAETPSVWWTEAIGSVADNITRRAGAYDLVVTGRAAGPSLGAMQGAQEAALFSTGRPLLLAPPNGPRTIGEHILIAWNRGAPAARAVLAAMPFLERTRSVRILMVATGAKPGPAPQEIADYLAWHNVRANVEEVPPANQRVSEVLLEKADEIGADLLVMGAFSHYRLREVILGGVTKDVLAAATMPVLMTH